MATRSEASSRHQNHQQYQSHSQSRQQPLQHPFSPQTPVPKSYTTYTLYPDVSRRKPSIGVSSQAQASNYSVQQQQQQQHQYSTQDTPTSSQTRTANSLPQVNGRSRSHSNSNANQGGYASSASSTTKPGSSMAASNTGHSVISNTNARGAAPLTSLALSPPSAISQGYVLVSKSTTRVEEVPSSQLARQQRPQHQEQPIYGGSVPRASLQGSVIQQRQRSGSASATTSAKNAIGTKSYLDRPSLITTIPSSSLFLSFDSYHHDSPLSPNHHSSPQDQENLRQQALLYQQKLKQRPPAKNGQGEDTDEEDSDTGSIVSYRRSIHRLSMTYKGRAGVPNISLFSLSQKPSASAVHPLAQEQSNVKQHTKSSSGINNRGQRGGHLQHKQQLQYGGGPTATTTDRRSDRTNLAHQQHQQRQSEENRPIVLRANTENAYLSASAYEAQKNQRDARAPERSTSADNIHSSSTSSNGYTRSTAYQQQQQQYYGGNSSGGPILRQGSAPAMTTSPPSSSHHQQSQGHHGKSSSSSSNSNTANLPRPSQESSQSQFRSKFDGNEYRHGGNVGGHGHNYGRSKSSDRSRDAGGGSSFAQVPFKSGSSGQSHHPIPAIPAHRAAPSKSGQGVGGSSTNLNMHPAHHLPSGGYVRPEEAVGPSNPMPEKAEDYVRQGIDFHELGDIAKATRYFRTAAELGDPVGMLMYGLSVRHGWGCTPNRILAFQYLQKSAEHAVGDLKSRDSFASTAAKGELVLAIYELGICFRHGWGVEKNKKTAAYYFEIAANLVSLLGQ